MTAQFVGSVDHGRVLAANDAVLEQDLRVVQFFINTQLALEVVVIEGVIESDPVDIGPSCTLLESFQGEANGAVSLFLGADPT